VRLVPWKAWEDVILPANTNKNGDTIECHTAESWHQPITVPTIANCCHGFSIAATAAQGCAASLLPHLTSSIAVTVNFTLAICHMCYCSPIFALLALLSQISECMLHMAGVRK
jgi:hypothetical protein